MKKAALYSVFLLTSLVAVGLLVALNMASKVTDEMANNNSTLQRASSIVETFARETPTPTPAPNLLLPDMTISEPKEIYVTYEGNRKLLRFSTTFINRGKGTLELIGHFDTENNITYATQYIQEINGPGVFHEVGAFEFHPTHDHWHMENYVFYQLIPLNQDAPIAETEKRSFCLWDEDYANLGIENESKQRVYTFDCDTNTQGISLGWSDTYPAFLDGQELDITDFEDGIYRFKSIVNPLQQVREISYDNNTSEVVIEIEGNRLTVK